MSNVYPIGNSIKINLVAIYFLCLFLRPEVVVAQDWSDVLIKTTSYDYKIIADDNTSHRHRVEYKAIISGYTYQTGDAQFPDNRKCHWGSARKLIRDEYPIDASLAHSGPWMSKRSVRLYAPNLFGKEIAKLAGWVDFEINMIENYAFDDDDKWYHYPLKILGYSTSRILTLNFGLNCGEAASRITSEREALKKSLLKAFPITIINYYVHAAEISRNWFYIDSEGNVHRASVAIPEIITEAYKLGVASEVESVTSILTGRPASEDLIKKYSNMWEDGNWQKAYYTELGDMISSTLDESLTGVVPTDNALFLAGPTNPELNFGDLSLPKPIPNLEICVIPTEIKENVTLKVASRDEISGESVLHERTIRVETALYFCGGGCYIDYDPEFEPLGHLSMILALKRITGQSRAHGAFYMNPLQRIAAFTTDDGLRTKITEEIMRRRNLIEPTAKQIRLFESRSHSEYRKCLVSIPN